MKKIAPILSVLIFSVLVLSTCSDLISGNGNASININLGSALGKGARSISTSDLKHIITFSGPTGIKTLTISGGGTASITVAAGLWEITVEAYLGDELYAVGSGSVEVKAGKTSNVSIQMNVVWGGLYDDGSGRSRNTTISIAIGFKGGTDPALGFNDALALYPGLELSYELKLIDSASNYEEIPVNAATGKASKQVSPGDYSIAVQAKLNGWDYAIGTEPVFAVSDGETKNISITMQRLADTIVLSVKKDELLDFGSDSNPFTPDPIPVTVYNFSDTPIPISASISGTVFSGGSSFSLLPNASMTVTVYPTTLSSADVYEEKLTVTGNTFTGVVDLRAIAYSALIDGQPALNAIRGNLSGSYTLAYDFTLSGNWTPIGSYPGGGDYSNVFSGNFDGAGHTISGLTITSSGSGHGLFGYIAPGGVVKNLRLDNVNISITGVAGNWVGAVAGGNAAGTVENCYVEGTVQGYDQVGAIVGRNLGTVQNCYSEGSVIGNGAVGGIVGMNDEADTVKNCYSLATVSGDNLVGGIVGSYYRGKIENCVALNLSVTASTSDGGRISGGTSPGSIATLSGNYAKTGMTVTVGGSPSTPSGTTGDINGANVDPGTTSVQYNDQDFWDSLGWDFTPITGIWQITSGGLPELQ